jgi:hypothetical protein
MTGWLVGCWLGTSDGLGPLEIRARRGGVVGQPKWEASMVAVSVIKPTLVESPLGAANRGHCYERACDRGLL